ncbi:MAG: DUF892 family protein [Bacteroidota bacterium]
MNKETFPQDSTGVKKADLIKNACNDLQKAFRNQLKDLFRAEKKLAKALPRISMASNSKEREKAYKSHLEETKSQVKRLDLIFELLGKKTAVETVGSKESIISTSTKIPGNELTAPGELRKEKSTVETQNVHFNSLKAITGLLNMKECHGLESFNGSSIESPIIANVHSVSFDLVEMNEEGIQVA